MKFIMYSSDLDRKIIMFECDPDEEVIKAKSICRDNIFPKNQITDFRVIHNVLNCNLKGHGEFGLSARVDGKDYSFIILPNPNDLLNELNSEFENKSITTDNALNEFIAINSYSYIWDEVIINNDESDDDLTDANLVLDVNDRIMAQHAKEFKETDKEIGLLIEECAKKYGLA